MAVFALPTYFLVSYTTLAALLRFLTVCGEQAISDAIACIYSSIVQQCIASTAADSAEAAEST